MRRRFARYPRIFSIYQYLQCLSMLRNTASNMPQSWRHVPGSLSTEQDSMAALGRSSCTCCTTAERPRSKFCQRSSRLVQSATLDNFWTGSLALGRLWLLTALYPDHAIFRIAAMIFNSPITRLPRYGDLMRIPMLQLVHSKIGLESVLLLLMYH